MTTCPDCADNRIPSWMTDIGLCHACWAHKLSKQNTYVRPRKPFIPTTRSTLLSRRTV